MIGRTILLKRLSNIFTDEFLSLFIVESKLNIALSSFSQIVLITSENEPLVSNKIEWFVP